MHIPTPETDNKLTFARESLADAWAEMSPLVELNHQESGALRELKPDLQRYSMLEETRHFFLFTMRVAGRLVGYVTFFISEHLHSIGEIIALQDVFYVVKEHRTRAVLRFTTWSDEQMKQLGAKAILRHAGLMTRFGDLLQKFGYQAQEITYMRTL